MRRHLTYANVMSSIAVFMVLGGSAYAAATLPKNSVGSKQIKSNAVTSSKVRNGSLLSKDFKKGQLKAGPTGPAGPAGPAGANGANGADGRDFSAATTLAPGATETGQWAAYAPVGSGGYIGSAQTFRLPLASTPAAGSAHYIANAAAYSTGCPGPGQAASGQLCVYEVSHDHASPGAGGGFSAIYSDEGSGAPSGRAARDGFQLYFTMTSGGSTGAYAHGTYAVTG